MIFASSTASTLISGHSDPPGFFLKKKHFIFRGLFDIFSGASTTHKVLRVHYTMTANVESKATTATIRTGSSACAASFVTWENSHVAQTVATIALQTYRG